MDRNRRRDDWANRIEVDFCCERGWDASRSIDHRPACRSVGSAPVVATENHKNFIQVLGAVRLLRYFERIHPSGTGLLPVRPLLIGLAEHQDRSPPRSSTWIVIMALPPAVPPGPDALFQLVWDKIKGRVVVMVACVLNAAEASTFGDELVEYIGMAVRYWILRHYDSLSDLPVEQVIDTLERLVFHKVTGVAIRAVWLFRKRAKRSQQLTIRLAEQPARFQEDLALRLIVAKEVFVRWRIFDVACLVMVLRYYLIGVERLAPPANHPDFIPTPVRIHRCKEKFLRHFGGSPI